MTIAPRSSHPSDTANPGAATATRHVPPARTVVLGIGNPLMGDDGVGIQTIQRLIDQPDQLAFAGGSVEVIDGGTLGYLLIDRLTDVAAWIVVDAANLGASAGDVNVFRGEDMDAFLTANRSSSVHEVGLIDLMEMLALTGSLPPRRALVAVQPEIIDWQTDLSPTVAASVARAEAAVIEVLRDWQGVTTS